MVTKTSNLRNQTYFVPETGGGGGVPPLVDVALLVELLPLVVEAVGDLVPDHHPDPTKVERFGEELVVEGRLQDASGEHDLVPVPAVVGVHHRWCRCPDRPVDRLSEHRHLSLGSAVQVGQHVLEELLFQVREALDLGLELLVAQHQVRITDVVDHCVQFAPVRSMLISSTFHIFKINHLIPSRAFC